MFLCVVDWAPDSGAEQTPFESALVFLETMKRERQLGAKVIEELRRKIKEAVRMKMLASLDGLRFSSRH